MGGVEKPWGPNLQVTEVRVQDFRSIGDLWMPLGQTVVLLGENNSGKTSLLAALDVALGSTRAREDDLRRAPNVSRFVIDVRLEPANGNDFDDATQNVLGNGPIQLRTDRAYFAIRSRGEIDPKRGEFTFKRTFLKGWARERENAEKVLELPTLSVNREHRELITFSMLDARRDAVEQLRNRRTFWGELLSDLKLSQSVREDVESTLADVRAQLKSESPPLSALQNELQAIRQVIDHDQLDVEVSALPTNVEDLLRGMDLLFTEIGQGQLPLAMQGMGTRSLSALLIFRTYVRAMLAAKQGAGTLSVAAFEEPESHLHPQAQRSVLRLIQGIPGQRLISTHSPYVAGLADVFDVRVFRRRDTGTSVSWIDEFDSAGKPAFDPEQLSHLRRFVQQRHGEILFARVVGLFEGETEDALLPTLAHAHWKYGPDAVGISLVNVGGAGNYKHLIPVLERLAIPWVIFSDGDQAGRDGLAATGRALKRSLDDTSAEVVMLPNGEDFEAYLLAQGFRNEVEAAINSFFGSTALTDYKEANHGQKLSRGRGVRDYASAGWEDRLVLDFMVRHKGTYGTALAEQLVSVGKIPERVQVFFDRIADVTGGAGRK